MIKFHGISKYNNSGKFKARVFVDRKEVVIGVFDLKITAAEEYDKFIIANNLSKRLNFFNENMVDGKKAIQLTKGKIAVVDPDDYERANELKWYTKVTKGSVYAARRYKENGVYVNQDLHHFIMGDESPIIDHIDGDGLNNCKSNLRFCNHQCNLMNQRKQKNRTSIYKGVFKPKNYNKFIAMIKINQKSIHLGVFDNEIDAAFAYDDKAKILFGEFANLNFNQNGK